MKVCAEIIQTNMLQEDYKVIPFSAYKDGSRAFSRMLDLCDRFVPANQLIISDHKSKTKAKKKTRRYVPTQEFIAITEVMTKIQEIVQRINLKPVKSSNIYPMSFYYGEQISEFNRVGYDTTNQS